jgi:pimeloyl-ACP methyl ester carboxylesterase
MNALARCLLVASLACGCAHPGPPRAPGAPAATAERFLAVEGTAGRLRVSDGGAGEPAIVFLHGLGSDLEAWRAQLDHLRSTRRAIAYDQRGHGASDKAADGAYTLEALVADLEAVRRALGLGQVVLVGHSMSGAVLTMFAAEHPGSVAGLVYVDAIGDFQGVPREELQKVIDLEASPSFGATERRAAFEEFLGARARPATREQVLAALGRIDPPAFAALRRSMFQFREAQARYAGYRGAALAIEAADNPYAAVMASQVLHLPRAEVAGVSHWLQIDDPGAVNRALGAFLASLPAPAAR